jgi:DnaD/phage-associated family protein
MTSRIWIKLYIEIMDDPKMGRLPNHLWRRAVELFLLAGREGNDGALPPVEEMAWTLHLSEDKVLEDLHGLAEVGVVHEAEPGKWVVTNFAKRQAALPVAERVRRSRIRDDPVTIRNSSCNDYVTNRYKTCNESGGGDSSSTSISSSVSESLEEERVQGEGKPADIFRAYEQNIGAITPMIADALRDAEKSDGPDWIIAAIEEAVRNNARSWNYCESILRRWRRDGFRVDTKPARTGSRQRSDGKLTPEQLAAWVEDRQKVET